MPASGTVKMSNSTKVLYGSKHRGLNEYKELEEKCPSTMLAKS